MGTTNLIQAHELVEDMEYSDEGKTVVLGWIVEYYGMPEELMELLLKDLVKRKKVEVETDGWNVDDIF